MSQIVHVVSIEEVMMSFGERVFQSRDVRGAVCSGVLEFERRARGVSLRGGGDRVFTVDVRVMVFDMFAFEGLEGRDHSRRWSPDVARRSVDCFWEIGGSHNIRVTGYEQVASAIRIYSMPYCGAPGAVASCGVICVSRIWILLKCSVLPNPDTARSLTKL
jgi:hypothetical protein